MRKTGTRGSTLAARVPDAVIFALDLHRSQVRKDTTIPYASHLLAVSSLVLESGGTEDEAIAALLHDTVEDQGGQPTLEEIRRRFGDVVAGVVEECSGEDKSDGTSWRTRKQRYLTHLPEASPSALLVSLADKVHNARWMLQDYREIGDRLWERFNADEPKCDSILWF